METRDSLKLIKFTLLITPILLARINGFEIAEKSKQKFDSSSRMFTKTLSTGKFVFPKTTNLIPGFDHPRPIPPYLQRESAVDRTGVKISQKYSKVKIVGGNTIRRENEIRPGWQQVTALPVTSTTVSYSRINNMPDVPKNNASSNFLYKPALEYLPLSNTNGRGNVSGSHNNSKSGWFLQNLTPPGVFLNSEGNYSVRADGQCKLSDRNKCGKPDIKRQGGISAISDLGELGELTDLDELSSFNNQGNTHNKQMFICWINTKRYQIPLEIIVFILRFSNTCFSIPTSIGMMFFKSIGDAIMRVQDTTLIIVDNFKTFLRRFRRKLFFKLFPYLNRLREVTGPVRNNMQIRPVSAGYSNVAHSSTNLQTPYMNMGTRALIL